MTDEEKSIKHNYNSGVETTGILSQGYGILAKLVMRDTNISIEAKAIYSYIISFAGAGKSAFPSISLMCSDLNISESRFYKHFRQLVDAKYIRVHKRKSNNKFSNNVYEVVMDVKHSI